MISQELHNIPVLNNCNYIYYLQFYQLLVGLLMQDFVVKIQWCELCSRLVVTMEHIKKTQE